VLTQSGSASMKAHARGVRSRQPGSWSRWRMDVRRSLPFTPGAINGDNVGKPPESEPQPRGGMVRLSEFIVLELEPILLEWEHFARTILPGAAGLSVERLRDHAREMLLSIAQDMEGLQSASAQLDKSRGLRIRAQPDADSAAEIHAKHRLGEGFSLNELVAEYRALRASVIRLWTAPMGQADRSHLDELTRFNEAIDEAVAESVARYTRQLERARNLMLGALGHDLRNPLGAILQSAQYLLRVEDLAAPHTKAAARVLSSGTRMKKMIADILDFASLRLGDALPITPTALDMGKACQAAVDELTAAHPNREIQCYAEGALVGYWDAVRIGQLLSNLIGNAIAYGAPDAPIWVRAESPSQDEVRVEVHNKGEPIAEERQRNLFEPLTRGAVTATDRPPADRSVGLGLYISCEIAKAHGGTLQLVASNQEGTVFAVQLPKNGLPISAVA
jgi:signal transduction histidine kinase